MQEELQEMMIGRSDERSNPWLAAAGRGRMRVVVSFAEPIWASGQRAASKAGHMTAVASLVRSCSLPLAPKGPSTHASRYSYVAPDSMQHVRVWLKVAGITEGCLFRAVNKGSSIGGPLTPGEVARVFKVMAHAAGVPAAGISAISRHSCRAGAAQDMVEEGIEMPHVMQAGGWRMMEMVSRYAKHLEARRGGSAKLAERQHWLG